jgi:hypothetical protein
MHNLEAQYNKCIFCYFELVDLLVKQVESLAVAQINKDSTLHFLKQLAANTLKQS